MTANGDEVETWRTGGPIESNRVVFSASGGPSFLMHDGIEAERLATYLNERDNADHNWAREAKDALRQRCGGCYKQMPLAEGYFDGDRWHEDGEQRQRCMNPESVRDLLARFPGGQ